MDYGHYTEVYNFDKFSVKGLGSKKKFWVRLGGGYPSKHTLIVACNGYYACQECALLQQRQSQS